MPDEDNNFSGSLVLDFREMMTSRATGRNLKTHATITAAEKL